MPSGNFTKRHVNVNCANCGKEIILTEGDYNFRLKRNKSGLFFCSYECKKKGLVKADIRTTRLICHKCEKDFTDELGKYEYNHRVKRLNETGRVFCSKTCTALFIDTNPEIRKMVADKERHVSSPQRGRAGHTVDEDTRDKIAKSKIIRQEGEGTKIELTCVQCGKIFHRRTRIHNQLTKRSKGRGPFCTPKCALTGRPVKQSTIEKIRESQIGVPRLQSGITGHPVSDETKINISLSKTGVSTKADWSIVRSAMQRLGISHYAMMQAPIPDTVFIENGKIVAVEVEKKRWETSIRKKMKEYQEHHAKWDKVIIMWYTPDSIFRKQWALENGSWRLVTS